MSRINELLVQFLEKSHFRLLLSAIGGASSAFALAVNLSIFWAIGRLAKIVFILIGSLLFSLIFFYLLRIIIIILKEKDNAFNNLRYIFSVVITLTAGTLIWKYYSIAAPVKWILGLGIHFEKAAVIVSGLLLFPVLGFILPNLFRNSLIRSAKNFVDTLNYTHYQASFIGFIIVFLGVFWILSQGYLGLFRGMSVGNNMMAFYAWTKYQLGDELFPYVIRSDENWMIFADTESIPDFQNTWPFTSDELQLIETRLINFNNYLANKGTELYIIFPPNKNTIYPEYMPEEIPVLGEKSRMDQVVEIFKQHPEINYIDLERIFLEERNYKQVYYATDSHWNNWGTFTAYSGLINSISEDYPEIQPHAYEYFNLPPSTLRVGDIANLPILDIKEEFSQSLPFHPEDFSSWTGVDFERFLQMNSVGPRLIMFHDSFGYNLIPLLIEHFSYSSFIHGWIIDPMVIEAEQPDIVIFEITERKLYYLMQIPDL